MLMEAESHLCKTGHIACFSNTNDHSTYQTYLDDRRLRLAFRTLICPSCAAPLPLPLQPRRQGGGNEGWVWGTLPAGVKFDPSDQQILEHLEAKVKQDTLKLHPLIPEFIPTLEGDDGICYTHPQNLPGMRKDGQIRHFFHRPSKAYTAGRRKRRKVHTDDEQEYETRWHKTGKTRPVVGADGGGVMGFKKILVLYTNYGSQRKPQKTNWIMHQYHLGVTEDEEDGQLVASKVFFQTQPRQSASSIHNTVKDWDGRESENNGCNSAEAAVVIDYGVPREFDSSTSYGEEMQYRENLVQF